MGGGKRVLPFANLPSVNNIDNFTNSLQSLIYDYFASNYGTLETKTISSVDRNKSINKLKKELKQLKVQGRNNHNYHLQIKALSKEIRSKLSALKAQKKYKKNSDITNQLQQKFCPTCKKLFNPSNSSLPLFNVTECEKFFKNILNNQHTKKFRLPNWIHTPPDPSFPYSVDPPTYNEISSIIRKCKSRASPCPLDQISIIILKKCPIIRTISHQLLVECWKSSVTDHTSVSFCRATESFLSSNTSKHRSLPHKRLSLGRKCFRALLARARKNFTQEFQKCTTLDFLVKFDPLTRVSPETVL
ncbi:hypothetical protein HELRODRAFT_175849 [Helobdella robusta]|uniref:Uncharacterized protein n=1 Tax=Helobdella robusta TaxID=6412 RepID=T1F9R9_HELRO|nr:hypothetical protein HELRODRAFT_175849 [Helobdella robusta]ESO00427.1 hypothetical protein HELRODRAFT_175849 [Helobdella robusta]